MPEEYCRRNPERPRQWLSGQESPGFGVMPLAPYGVPAFAPRPAYGYVPVGALPMPGTRAYAILPVLIPVAFENPADTGVII